MVKKPKLRRWRIVVLRKKGERLGTVEAPDADAAIKVAIQEFQITDRTGSGGLRPSRLSRR